jgi:hypothetical protein
MNAWFVNTPPFFAAPDDATIPPSPVGAQRAAPSPDNAPSAAPDPPLRLRRGGQGEG